MKQGRHAKITELIRENRIETQEELADRLRKEGFQVTQATVSRDIRTLGLTKKPAGDGKQYYVLPGESVRTQGNRYLRVLKEGFVSMDMAQNILVIRTAPGMASAVCAALDSFGYEEIVGSIAGDDTIMCAIRTPEDTKTVMGKIQTLLHI